MSAPTVSTEDTVVIHPPVLYFGTPVILLTTTNRDGTSNITPMSSAWALADRIVLGLASAGHGAANLLQRRDCVINVACARLWKQVERIARLTGRPDVPAHKARLGYTYAPDKFARGGFTPVRADTVRAARIRECPLQIEASLLAAHGDFHGICESPVTFEIQVQRVHAHRDIVIPDSHHIDVTRWQPLLYVFRHYVAAGATLGTTFKAPSGSGASEWPPVSSAQ